MSRRVFHGLRTSGTAYNTRAAVGFAYIAVAFLILAFSVVFGHRKPGISCCGSKVCAEQHHHE